MFWATLHCQWLPKWREYMANDNQKNKLTRGSTSRRRWKWIGRGALIFICVILGGSVISNLLFPARPDVIDLLSKFDKARVAEFFHMRRAVGDSLWAGWANANIPVVTYNEEYVFLIGVSNPTSGWRTVPNELPQGVPWEVVPRDSIDGKEYYRQRIPPEGSTPQAFTVRVGELWAASLTTKEWMTIKMGNEIRDGLPPLVRHIVPYRLLARTFLGLAMNTDAYICAIGHEAFHAFQGMAVPDRIAMAEQALRDVNKRYPWDDPSFSSAWRAELNTVADALATKDDKVARELTGKFLSLRRARRISAHLDSAMVNLERQREWLEGLGKYTELALWKRVSADSGYRPIRAILSDPDFDGYKDFGRHWAQELSTLRSQSKGDEIRFYYAGMAQAFLLDRFSPEWRTTILRQGVYLEDLLEEAVTQHSAQLSWGR
jgi:hypothetical protein